MLCLGKSRKVTNDKSWIHTECFCPCPGPDPSTDVWRKSISPYTFCIILLKIKLTHETTTSLMEFI